MKNNYKISMRRLAQELKNRRNNRYDCVLIVDGPRGNGKSTFLYKLFIELGCEEHGYFLPERDIVFSREDLIKKFKEKFGLIMQDEMINAAHNRDFYEKDQKMLIKMLNMYRDNYNIMGGAVPFFYDLDPQVRKFVFLRVTVVERGKAIIQKARNSMFTNDPWETDANRKLELKMQSTMKKGKKLNVNCSKLTTFWGNLTYGPLGKMAEERYFKIKEDKRNKMMDAEPVEVEKEKTDIEKMAIKYYSGKIDKKDVESYCRLHEKKMTSMMTLLRRARENLMILAPRSNNKQLVS